jgi:cephalosporin hydroxylase
MNLNEFIATTAVQRYGALQKQEELAWLIDKISTINPKIIIEIGCDAGGTLYAWNRLAPEVLGIDLPGGPYATGRPLTTHGSTIILGDSHDLRVFEAAKGYLMERSADMLFIDGDHQYNGIRMDFELYSGLVRPGGAIVLQDIRDHHREDVGVHRVWNELKGNTDPDQIEECIAKDDQDWAGIGIYWQPKEEKKAVDVT